MAAAAAAWGPLCSTRRLGCSIPGRYARAHASRPRLGDDSGAGRWPLGPQQVARYYRRRVRCPDGCCDRAHRAQRARGARGAKDGACGHEVRGALAQWGPARRLGTATLLSLLFARKLPVRCLSAVRLLSACCPSHGFSPAMAVTHTAPTCCHHRWAPSPPARSLTCCRRRPLAVPRLPLPLNACCAPSASAS
jgi:hypothetical protein